MDTWTVDRQTDKAGSIKRELKKQLNEYKIVET